MKPDSLLLAVTTKYIMNFPSEKRYILLGKTPIRTILSSTQIIDWPTTKGATLIKSNRKAMNRNWCNQKANPALKTKTGNKYIIITNRQNTMRTNC